MRRALLGGVAALVAVGAAWYGLHEGHERKVREPIEYWARELNTGRKVSLDEYRGQPVLLTSWATWCVECRKELPTLVDAWQSRRGRGLMVIAVNLDALGEEARVSEMIRLYSLTMPVWRDEGNAYSAAFEAPGVPTSVLLDAHGVLVQRWIGRVDFRADDVTTQIDSLLPR